MMVMAVVMYPAALLMKGIIARQVLHSVLSNPAHTTLLMQSGTGVDPCMSVSAAHAALRPAAPAQGGAAQAAGLAQSPFGVRGPHCSRDASSGGDMRGRDLQDCAVPGPVAPAHGDAPQAAALLRRGRDGARGQVPGAPALPALRRPRPLSRQLPRAGLPVQGRPLGCGRPLQSRPGMCLTLATALRPLVLGENFISIHAVTKIRELVR